MTDGDRNARLNETRSAWSFAGLNTAASRGENTGSLEVAELVDAAAEREAEPVEEDLVLHVGAELGAVLGVRRDRDVEVVAARRCRRR